MSRRSRITITIAAIVPITTAALLPPIGVGGRKDVLQRAFISQSSAECGEAVKQLAEIFGQMKIELADKPLRIKFVPEGETLSQCRSLGLQIAQKLNVVLEKNG